MFKINLKVKITITSQNKVNYTYILVLNLVKFMNVIYKIKESTSLTLYTRQILI